MITQTMVSRILFIVPGLAVASVGEFVNNFIIGIEHTQPIGNFMFAMVFYATVLCFVAYPLQARWIRPGHFWSVLKYMLVFGVIIGLVINEWILVGNHPFNPSAAHPVTQFSMLAFHSLLYLFPVVMVHFSSIRKQVFRLTFILMVFALAVSIVATFAFQTPESVMAVNLIATYYVAYDVSFIYLLYKISKTTKVQLV